MSRDLTSDLSTALGAATVRPILIFEAQYVSTTVRYWTGIGTLSWNGYDWLGVGDLVSATEAQETDDLKATGITVTVSGASSGAIAASLGEMRGGKPGIVRLALLDEVGAIVPDPKVVFRGRLDLVEIDDTDPEKPVLRLAYEHELLSLDRARERRYTNEFQQQLYPGDRGLEFIVSLQDAQIVWGRR